MARFTNRLKGRCLVTAVSGDPVLEISDTINFLHRYLEAG